jgi:hypothetical protein
VFATITTISNIKHAQISPLKHILGIYPSIGESIV